MSDLAVRLKTAAILLTGFALGFILMQDFWLMIVLFLISILGIYELFDVYEVRSKKALVFFNTLFLMLFKFHFYFVFFGCFIVIFAILLMLFGEYVKLPLKPIALSFSIILFDVFVLGLINIYNILGYFWLFKIFLFVAIADAGAYFVGKAFGRTKLAQSISPKKTYEGALGAILLVNLLMFFSSELYLLATFLVILAILGDLWFSYNKRLLGIKDFSNLLPGHGGVLDRVDALTFVVPFFCLYANLFAKTLLVS